MISRVLTYYIIYFHQVYRRKWHIKTLSSNQFIKYLMTSCDVRLEKSHFQSENHRSWQKPHSKSFESMPTQGIGNVMFDFTRPLPKLADAEPFLWSIKNFEMINLPVIFALSSSLSNYVPTFQNFDYHQGTSIDISIRNKG